jgi:hypothetical protein
MRSGQTDGRLQDGKESKTDKKRRYGQHQGMLHPLYI